jgi:beta-glucosidase
MSEGSFHFPRGFLWGTATAAHQVEGANTNNNWYAWEQEGGHVLNDDRSGKASDWWGGRWKDDFSRAHQGGQNAHRFSIEWSRIEPKPGKWDNSALDRYREMARWLVDHKMTPMVTLHHFTDPLWLTGKGGWQYDQAPSLFDKFVAKSVGALREYVDLWCTINEPNVYSVDGHLLGIFPPGKTSVAATFEVLANLLRAHTLSYHTIHSAQPQARVGFAIQHTPIHPHRRWFLPDRFLARILGYAWNDSFPKAVRTGTLRFLNRKLSMPRARDTMDYLGMNYYFSQEARFSLRSKTFFAERMYPKNVRVSPSGEFANDPPGMFESFQWARSFGLPIYITENGIEDEPDTLRPRYIVEHIRQLWRAVNFNYQVKGYFHWSLVDNFEWQAGWSQRFGLWGLDLATQTRIRRRSGDLYAEICKENGLTSDMVRKYTPEIYNDLFPD